jgi:hypothetical protein
MSAERKLLREKLGFDSADSWLDAGFYLMMDNEKALAFAHEWVAAGHPIILAFRQKCEVGEILPHFYWSTSAEQGAGIGRIDQPTRVIRIVDFETFRKHMPPNSQGWQNGPGSYYFYEVESD